MRYLTEAEEEAVLMAYLEEVFADTYAKIKRGRVSTKRVAEGLDSRRADIEKVRSRRIADSENAAASRRDGPGEIEARNTAGRRKLTAKKRKKLSPNYGDEDTVFASPGANEFSIEMIPDGERIVGINTDQNLFFNKPLNEFPKIARKVIMDKFISTVLALGENDLAKVGKRSWEEYAYPSVRLNPSSREFETKMRAATELNNLLETAEFSHWEENKKPSKKDVYSYDYYKVRFILAGHLFEGLINIENNKSTRLFYDITKIKEIPDTSGKYAALMAQSTSAFGNLYNDSIQQNGQKVKQDFSVAEDVTELDEDYRSQAADMRPLPGAVEELLHGVKERRQKTSLACKGKLS